MESRRRSVASRRANDRAGAFGVAAWLASVTMVKRASGQAVFRRQAVHIGVTMS